MHSWCPWARHALVAVTVMCVIQRIMHVQQLCQSSARRGQVLYAAGPVAGMPERYAARRERFAELDRLQPGWRVELRGRRGGDDAVDACFTSPAGTNCAHVLPPCACVALEEG